MTFTEPPGDPRRDPWGPPATGSPGTGSSSIHPPGAPPPGAPSPATCYRHPTRPAGAVCRRCNRPICPECMREAPVGWQCASCVHEGAHQSPTVRWRPRSPGRLGATRMTPMVMAIIAINIIVYLLSQADFNRTISRFALWPYQIHQGQTYRLLTAAFLHANLEHIAFNMLTLAIIGPPVEAELGRVRFGVLYLVSALGGSVASYLLSSPNELGVGASGAIFGLMGAYFVLARRHRWDLSTIGVLIVVNLVIGFASSTIDWRAHLGGLAAGAVMAFAFSRSNELRARAGVAVSVVVSSASVVVVLGVLAALAQVAPGHFNL